MSNFKTPLAIHGSMQQLLKLTESLLELGYQRSSRWHDPSGLTGPKFVLVTDDMGRNGMVNIYNENGTDAQRTNVEADQKMLIMGLAAMREGDQYFPGEQIMVVDNGGTFSSMHDPVLKITRNTLPTRGYIYRYVKHQRSFRNDAVMIESNVTGDCFLMTDEPRFIRKATVAEISKVFGSVKHIGQEKKIIGYKVKQGVDRKAAGRAVDTTFHATSAYAFGFDSQTHREAIRLGLLDILFEPVYEDTILPGDWVKVVGSSSGSIGAKGVVGQLMNPDFIVNESYVTGQMSRPGSGQRHIHLPSNLIWRIPAEQEIRKATPEEINQAKQRILTMTHKDEAYNVTVKANDKFVYVSVARGNGGEYKIEIAGLKELFDLNDKAKRILSVSAYHPKIEEFAIGCKKFTVAQLGNIITAHKELNFVPDELEDDEVPCVTAKKAGKPKGPVVFESEDE